MKLSGWTYFFIFFFAGASVFAYAYLWVYAPLETAADYNRTYFEDLKRQADLQPKADQRVRKAVAKVQEAALEWNTFVATKTPPDTLQKGGVNVYENHYQLVVDTPKFRNNAQRAFNSQLRVGGVKIISAPDIPMPSDSETDILASYYNYPAFSFPVVLWELGSVTVQGTYAQIMKNVRSWSTMPHYLAVVDGLSLTGTSPILTGTYNVTIVGYIHATQVFPLPAVQMGGGSGAGGAGGGGGATPGAGRGGPGGGGGGKPGTGGGGQTPSFGTAGGK